MIWKSLLTATIVFYVIDKSIFILDLSSYCQHPNKWDRVEMVAACVWPNLLAATAIAFIWEYF